MMAKRYQCRCDRADPESNPKNLELTSPQSSWKPRETRVLQWHHNNLTDLLNHKKNI